MIKNSKRFVAFRSIVIRGIIDFVEDKKLLPFCNASVAIADAVAEFYFSVEVLRCRQRPGVVCVDADLAYRGCEIENRKSIPLNIFKAAKKVFSLQDVGNIF